MLATNRARPSRRALYATLRVSIGLTCGALGACRSCEAKQVPFKRGGTDAASSASEAATPAASPQVPSAYPDGTQQVQVGDMLIERPAGTIRASLPRDLDGDHVNDVLLITTDAEGHALFETIMHGSSEPRARLPLEAGPKARCRAVVGNLAPLSGELVMASLAFLCDTEAEAATASAAPATPSPAAATAQPDAPPMPLDMPPPEPSSAEAQTHWFVIDVTDLPRRLLHLSTEAGSDDRSPSLELALSGTDIDNDEHGDVQVAIQIVNPSGNGEAEPFSVTLSWLNRPSGLARERQEPEKSLMPLAQEAWRLAETKPVAALATAAKALDLHRLVCRETGQAKLWVDDARGIPCGPSAAAGKAAAARTIALAKQQAILPALEARAALERSPAFALDSKGRERVAKAIGALRGDTEYRWQMGPSLRAPGAPAVRLPAIGFIDEDHLLLRGPIPQSYDLRTQTATPAGIPGSIHASDREHHFAIVDIFRSCSGYQLRIVPASQLIGGIVTGTSVSEPLLEREATELEPGSCSASSFSKSDRGGYTLLGLHEGGALFARGASLVDLPLDASAHGGEPRWLGPYDRAPALDAPGALDASGRFFASASTEGVVVVDRSTPANSKLVRKPASCATGPVSDAALSPSARKLAMLCGGHVYVAAPAADGGGEPRPTSESP